MEDLEAKIQAAQQNPQNVGEMADADSVGTVGSPDCGDMLRMWVKFKDQDGKKVIDRATFQTFGCQTAIAVASVATELIAGKTVDEALALSGEELAAPLGALAADEDSLRATRRRRAAFRPRADGSDDPGQRARNPPAAAPASAPTLYDSLTGGTGRPPGRKVKVVLMDKPAARARSDVTRILQLFPCTKTPKSPSAATWKPSRFPSGTRHHAARRA